jgi:hypothetical protein
MKHPQEEDSPIPNGATNGTTVNGDSSELKDNVGVYTDPEHKLWTSPAEPDVKNVLDGSTLKPGEVTIGIKNTGICGYTTTPSLLSPNRSRLQ